MARDPGRRKREEESEAGSDEGECRRAGKEHDEREQKVGNHCSTGRNAWSEVTSNSKYNIPIQITEM